ncbi:hypothetical protein SBOR_9584 [Sclerotinia borealis F-4128]|uniref:Zn(2)-C6 fungal-type domain-containing protein n=1 Tax=Sclerotinia borealis (strain F-4128) TaxID=1432307 RepID=W9C2U5_SCLBF|nr:hypothetical protein SBOR_9584 [Sclerotinia borealis F-4128]
MAEPTETERPVPYSRACINCARAKTKCNFGSNHSICERCGRLKKECVLSPVKRRQKPRVTAERLEQRLDGLVSLLRTISPNNPVVENALNSFPVQTSNCRALGFHSTAPNSCVRNPNEIAPVEPGLSYLPSTPASNAAA